MRHRSRVFLYVTIMFLFSNGLVHGQSEQFNRKKEEAVRELARYPAADTARVHALHRVVNTATYLKERKEVMPYAEEMLLISRKIGYSFGIVHYYMAKAAIHKSASEYKTAQKVYDTAIRLIKENPLSKLTGTHILALERKGSMYMTDENYYPALECYFDALKLMPDTVREKKVLILNFIAECYNYLNNPVKAEEYALNNVALAEKYKLPFLLTLTYSTCVELFLNKNDPDKAETYLNKLAPLVTDPKQVQLKFGYLLNRGHVAYLRKNYTEALRLYQETLQYAQAGGHIKSNAVTLRFLAASALKTGDLAAARKYTLQQMEAAQQSQNRTSIIDALINMANYQNQTGNSKRAYELLTEAIEKKDSLVEENNSKQINRLVALYETDKQQKEITKLEYEREQQAATVKRKSTLNAIFICSIGVLLLLGYLGYLYFRKTQQLARTDRKLQQQKITELEKDKQLLTAEAMLKGQEEERSRIAKDLHDGLGGLLSGTKISFQHVKENLVLTPENQRLFERSMNMLDHTITDLRKVAHNLMPEALVKFGLNEAVKDFCSTIRQSSGIKIIYQVLGEERKHDNTAAVFIYRIIQELVNNAVKHASATQIIVQLAFGEHTTEITVEDNGKGFDKRILLNTTGAGMANIQYRVQYFNGSTDIVTANGQGTSIHIMLKT